MGQAGCVQQLGGAPLQGDNEHDVYSLYASTDTALPQAQIFTGGAAQPVTGPSSLPVNAWSYVTATYDGSNISAFTSTGTRLPRCRRPVRSRPRTASSTWARTASSTSTTPERWTMSDLQPRAQRLRDFPGGHASQRHDRHHSAHSDREGAGGGSTGVSVGTNLTATFNESMDDTSLSPSSFVIMTPRGTSLRALSATTTRRTRRRSRSRLR